MQVQVKLLIPRIQRSRFNSITFTTERFILEKIRTVIRRMIFYYSYETFFYLKYLSHEYNKI